MTVEVCVSLRGGIVSQNFQLKLNVATENATGIDFTLPEATIGNTLIQLSLNQTSTRQCFSVEALMDQPPIVDDNEVVMFSLSCSPDPPELPVFIDTRPATVVIQDFGVILNDMFASQETNVTMANIEEVVSSVTTLTNQSVMGVSTQTEENLNTVATVFDGVARLLGVSASMSTNLTTETNTQIVMGLVDTIGSVLQWDPEVLAVNGSDIIRAFESVAAAYADRTILSVTVEITTADVAFVAENINTTVLQGSGRSFSSVESSSGVPDPATGGAMTPDTLAPNQTAFINLPASLFDRVPENRTNIGVFFALYDNPSLFPVAEAEVENSTRVITVLSPVIAATVGPGLFFMNLDPPISILLRLRELGEDEIMSFGSERCVSWNFSANGGEGNWTADGCETIGLVDGVVTCQCDHLTNFAILVDICSRINGSDCTPPPALTKALEVLTIIGVSLSLFGLVMTIITLTIVKKFRERDATKYHVQLCIAMICMLLVFITGINRTAVYGGCVLVSVLIHYFTLVAVLWMAAEALLMFQKLVIIFVSITTKYLVTISILCWTIPIVPVIIPLIVDLTTRPEQDIVVNRDQFCFLNHPGAFFGAFLGPIFALLIFNVVVFIWVIVVLVRHTKDTAERQKQQGMKKETAIRLVISISGIMFLFGLTWLFGALTITIRAVNLLFQVLFVVFNSLQGFFIFLFFCVFNKEGRDFWKEVLSCGRYKSELLHPSQAKYVSSGNQAHTEKKKKNEKKSSTDLQDTASTAVKSYNDSSLSYDTLDRTKDSDIPLVNIADDTKQVMTGEDIDPSTAQTIKGTLQSEKDTAVDILKE